MAPAASPAHASSKDQRTWRPVKVMNMGDLSKDDDFLSHLLVEKLGTGAVPLLVHKMDSSRRLPKCDAQSLLRIVRRLVVVKGPVQTATRQAVDELLLLVPIRYYFETEGYDNHQINAFATHASRYFELYHPSGSIEISHTSRYSHRTGKSELCILATRNLPTGTVITELKGSMANLSEEEDRELKRTDLVNSDIRRDFSVIHSKSMKKNHLFLGPARFVNHDCDNNCELFREGRYITFRTLRPIAIGEEITAHYGDSYFGRRNKHCLCETCEKKGRGGYAPDQDDDDPASDSDSDIDERDVAENGEEGAPVDVNLNERRTRRGVYAISSRQNESDESEEEGDDAIPLADAKNIPDEAEIEITTEIESESDLTSLTTGVANDEHLSSLSSIPTSPLTPSRSLSSLSSLTSVEDISAPPPPTTPQSSKSTPYRSIISTRRQKAREAQEQSGSNSSSPSVTSKTPMSMADKRETRSASSGKGKGKERPISTPLSTPSCSSKGKEKASLKEQVKVKKEESEPRILRARAAPAASSNDILKELPKLPEVPRDADGKPLPLCVTCHNILPVISVDSKVVWGLGLEISRKKKNKQDCPRCMRHFAIYGQPWPRRLPLPGSASVSISTPREASPLDSTPSHRVTHKALSVLDLKLAAAASVSPRGRKRRSPEDDHPSKRQKVEQGAAKSRSLSNVPSRGRAPLSGAHNRVESANAGGIEKRRRGRPRLRSLPPISAIVKQEPEDDDVLRVPPAPFKDQPRNHNGRFDKKPGMKGSPRRRQPQSVSTPILSRAQRATEREKMKLKLEREQEREHDTVSLSDGEGSKRSRIDDDDDEHTIKRTKHERNPKPAGMPSGSFVANPNPQTFAMSKWKTRWSPGATSESSEESDKGPVTPDDHFSPEPDVRISVNWLSTPSSVALTFKPTPGNFARHKLALTFSNPSMDGGSGDAMEPDASSSSSSTESDQPLHAGLDAVWMQEGVRR
ncbi:uncharacterized protein BT62DRAFT_1075804 [Guyanagaster necrorhizus]|uniref:SET domain-containing protein n=1 Tax=Guyanagaster necrorhizus TaxID=856835 RepID=A0A9P7VUA2_9AGAR|nr:uncharacterized protein BT62DRAFT_1075804 [Guyanagaster necrorhizus MCA 3950]KAG7446204.1 hypothetical protein BT62DRAFT_1075804 [Guyanagaster necrorhizus MCA 3950]